ncbi:rhodopsin kinase GRK7-like isoform X2 [Clavelina lepadiformis]|uniref:rhodopsin kinase GRK7-like isoform X2 n=1 Tax=Clavelina lepadiformis TaxID=159417 RepID=UPI0040417A77
MDMCGIEDMVANNVLVKAKSDGSCCTKWRKGFVLPDKSVCGETQKKIEIELQSAMPDNIRSDPKTAKEYEFYQLCEQQPIGKELFGKYCKAAEPKIKNAFALLQAIWDYEIASAEERNDAAQCVLNSHLQDGAPYEVMCLPKELKASCCALVSTESPTLDQLNEIMKPMKHTPDPQEAAKEVEPAKGLAITSLTDSYQPDVVITHLSADERRYHCIKMLFDKCKSAIYPFMTEEVFPKYKKSEEFETFVRWKWKEKEPVTEDDFLSFRLLGRGGFGEVYAYQVKTSGKLYACKKIDKKKMKQKQAEKVVLSEKITLEMVNSPFVVSLAYAYENKHDLNLVMTLMGSGDLKFHIYETSDKKRGLSKEQTKFYTAQITLGLDHLHRENILYRDMKPENVLLDDKGNVRIADLGLVCILPGDKKTAGRAGTVGFMAPEMLRGEQYAFGVDWFALGCTMFEMVEGKGPFITKGKNKRKMSVTKTIETTINEKHIYKRSHKEDLKDLIDQLLAKDVKKRLAGDERSAEPIKRHPYFADLNWERLEAGLVPVPFVPDKSQVYAKDVSDIRLASEAKGITISQEDKDFHKRFATGRVSIPWQREMMETGLYQEVMDRKDDVTSKTKKAPSKSKICIIL